MLREFVECSAVSLRRMESSMESCCDLNLPGMQPVQLYIAVAEPPSKFVHRQPNADCTFLAT